MLSTCSVVHYAGHHILSFQRAVSILYLQSVNILFARRFFNRPCFVLLSSLLIFEVALGFVGLRFFLVTATLFINSCNRVSAISLFFSWLRYSWALIIMTPSLVMRRSLQFNNRCLQKS